MIRVPLFAAAGAFFAVALVATPAGAITEHPRCVRSCNQEARSCRRNCKPPPPPQESKHCKSGCVQVRKSCVQHCPWRRASPLTREPESQDEQPR